MRKNTKYKVSQTRSLELVLWCSGLVGHYHDTQYARDSAMTSQLQYIWPSDRRQAPHRHCCQSDCRRDIWQRSCWRQWTHRQHYCRTYWHTYTALLSDILTHTHSTTVRCTSTCQHPDIHTVSLSVADTYATPSPTKLIISSACLMYTLYVFIKATN